MEDRRKIVIPVDSEPETPHFDAEETLLSARPVVPITPAETAKDFNGARANQPASFYKGSAFLTLVVIAAVGIGLAAGLSIARYRLQPAPATTAQQPVQKAAPVANDTRTATVQPAKDNQQAQTPALPEIRTEERTTAADDASEKDKAKTVTGEQPPVASAKRPESSGERTGEKDDNARSATSAPRDRKRTGDDEEGEDASRAQRRERRGRNRDEETIDMPRRIERASEQINRIREIFEGTQRP